MNGLKFFIGRPPGTSLLQGELLMRVRSLVHIKLTTQSPVELFKILERDSANIFFDLENILPKPNENSNKDRINITMLVKRPCNHYNPLPTTYEVYYIDIT